MAGLDRIRYSEPCGGYTEVLKLPFAWFMCRIWLDALFGLYTVR